VDTSSFTHAETIGEQAARGQKRPLAFAPRSQTFSRRVRPIATWAHQLREGDQQVDGEDQDFAHGANRSMTASARKTAPHRRIPPYYEFATHTVFART
jgi:hypothetical protein